LESNRWMFDRHAWMHELLRDAHGCTDRSDGNGAALRWYD
jgi:hypothetical protein